MVGDGDSTEDITLPLVFLFSREGAVLTAALEEHHNVDVLLLPKERQLGHGEDQEEEVLRTRLAIFYVFVIVSNPHEKAKTYNWLSCLSVLFILLHVTANRITSNAKSKLVFLIKY